MFGNPKSVLLSVVLVATKGHTSARGLEYYMWPCWCLRDMAARAMQIWVTSADIWEHGVVQLGLSKGHVWVYGLTSARINIDVHGSCYHRELGHWRNM